MSMHAAYPVTVSLSDKDFEDMVSQSLCCIVNEPYHHHIVVDEIVHDGTRWDVAYHIEKDEES
jgi:hypothetical protein